MVKFTMVLIGFLVLGLLIQSDAMTQPRERSEIPAQYTWNLKDIYPNDEAWYLNLRKSFNTKES